MKESVLKQLNWWIGNDFAGLWYPLAIAAICAIVCYVAVPETAHVNIEENSAATA